MRVKLCGELLVERDGQRVDQCLRRRKSRELLAFLADRGRPVPRAQLVELLWPGEPPGRRSGALRQLLSELRTCLGDDTVGGREIVTLVLAPGSVDVRVAGQALDRCRTAFETQDWATARAQAGLARSLLAEEFLAGSQADWALRRRDEIEQLALGAIEALGIASLAEPGHQRGAESAGRELIARSPFRETGYSLLMRALVAEGNLAEALRVYEDLRRLLRRELGTIPSLGLNALHLWVLAQPDEPGVPAQSNEQAPEPAALEPAALEPASGYARRADGLSIAYQVLGDGPVDLVIVPGFMSHLDCWWTFPEYRAWLRELASFARVITLDKAGTGASDPVDHVPTVTEWGEDALCVLDVVGSDRAVLFGLSEAGPVTIAMALAHPGRVAGLVLYAAIARWRPAPHYLWEHRHEILPALERFTEVELAGWGHGASVDTVAPSLGTTDGQRRAWAVFERASGSPTSIARRLAALNAIDVCELLPAVQTPTLVVHRSDDGLVHVHHGRHLAAAIPGARFAELAGKDHPPMFGSPAEVTAVVDAIRDFVSDVAATG